MDLTCETLLDVYTYNNKKILCQIKFNTNNDKFFNSCRCLSQEQWRAFDTQLEKLLFTIDDWKNDKCLKFYIKPSISVKVKKSSLSLRYFSKCLGRSKIVEDNGELKDGSYILECLFDFKREILFSSSIESQESDRHFEATLDLPCSPLSYDPYTPSKKTYKTNKIDTVKTPGIDFLEYDERTCSPKSISGKEADTCYEPPAKTESTKASQCETLSEDVMQPKETCSSTNSNHSLKGDDVGKDDSHFLSMESTTASCNLSEHYRSESLSKAVFEHDYKKNSPLSSSSHFIQCNIVEKYDTHISSMELKTDTCQLSEGKSSENLSKTFLDSENKIKSQLKPSCSSSKVSHSGQCNAVRNDETGFSPEKEKSLQIKSSKLDKAKGDQGCHTSKETKREKNYQEDKQRKERSKSEDFLLSRNDEKAKENHRHKKKKLKIDKNSNHYESKKVRKRSRTIDEVPNNLLTGTETISSIEKKKIIDEKPPKTVDTPVKISSHNKKDKNKDSLSKEKNTSEEAETSSHKRKTKASPKTPPIEISNSGESTIEASPQKTTRKERKLQASSRDKIESLRRSERSPSKPKRFIADLPQPLKKSKKHISSPKKRELFGTDDDEDELFETKKDKINKNDKKLEASVFETPICKKPVQSTSSSSSSSHRKKRKREKSDESCQQEKRDMSKWLSKKKSKPLDHESKTSSKTASKSKPLPLKTSTNLKKGKAESETKTRSKSVTPPPITIELPSKEELESIRNKTNLIRESNARVKAELDKMRISPPKEVEILSLENIPLDDILTTFLKYKADLDEIFQNNRKRDHIKGHDGINHCFIIRLLPQHIQMKMLAKLTDVYGGSNTTTQATLFANALLPEWVIRVYMDKFSFTRQQAIDQIEAQEAFKLHLEEQNENFVFD